MKSSLLASMIAASLPLAACYKNAEPPPSQSAQSAAPAAPAPGAAEGAPSAAAQPGPGGSPGLVSSHAPLGGAAVPAGSTGGAPGMGASPHGTLTWEVPDAWKQETPANAMRAAQYRVPAAAGDTEDGECVVFYFGPGQGGDAQSNVSRWTTMFTKPDGSQAESRVSEQKVGERLVTRVEASGTYHPTSMAFGGAAPPPRPGYMLLGAIVPGGDANWFFRCTGPQKTIGANKAGFDTLVTSVH